MVFETKILISFGVVGIELQISYTTIRNLDEYL